MNLKELSVKLSINNTKSELNASISNFLDNHDSKYDKKNIKDFIKKLSEDEFTAFGNNLGYCRNYCIEEREKSNNVNDDEYLSKVNDTINYLGTLSAIYQEINAEKVKDKNVSNEDSAIAQQKDVLKEINDKIKQFKTDINETKSEIQHANDAFNDKISSVLINTVAILGIFVAIAFTGFGVTSLFSNIDIKDSLISNTAFLRNTFFLLLISFLSYNLLLLLVYFIFKLSRPLFDKKENGTTSMDDLTFTKNIKLAPFFWVDGIVGLLTALSFFATFKYK